LELLGIALPIGIGGEIPIGKIVEDLGITKSAASQNEKKEDGAMDQF